MVTFIICVVLLIALGAALIYALRGLFMTLRMIPANFRAAKVLFTQPGADEAYEYIKQNSVKGNVSIEVMTQAIDYMISQGADPKDLVDFVVTCAQTVSFDYGRMESYIRRKENELRDLDYQQNMYEMQNGSLSAEQQFDVDTKKDAIREDIERTKQKMG